MDDKWKIEYYKTTNKKSPVEEFIFSLDVKAQNKIVDMLTLLKEFGVTLSLPHVKKLTGTSLRELRILGGDNIRFFYIAQTGKTFLLLHGFSKKKQKTDKKEINTAIKRLAEYKSRDKT
ncbi:MAG: hypothetical protein A3B41_00840 [Candidatus Levybacteria bacterium RIFCSPLOWO2_01_FULL_37_26]|nr:MAG: hypothetical protein A3B41_00840 [Candidatus Levybacteria bacterium RIFCSPLOWO2_01_FULL_37_26]